MDELVKALEARREGYDDEISWHRFLFDAYAGTGGFEGKEKRPSSETWGSAASIYAKREVSYLRAHRREDSEKFRRRRDAAHYDNYVEPLTDLKLSYMLRKQASVEDRPEQVDEWRMDIDGRGTTFDEVRPIVALRAAVFGWCPVLIDFPRPEVDPITKAQELELELAPRLIPMLPANICDWKWSDDGTIDWVKIRTDHIVRDSWSAEAREVQRYTIWTRTDFSIFDVETRNGQKVATPVEQNKAHGFGCVPLTICKHKRSGMSDGLGVPMHGSISVANRALFNYVSQLDEHLAEQAFAMLVWVQRESDLEGDEIEIGTNNAISLDPQASKQHYYLAPPSSVAEVLEKRIENTIREVYRMARIEYQKPTGGATSGVSRAYDFASTNQALSDFAGEIARWELWVDDVVGAGLGIAEEERELERISPPTRFDVDDLTVELQQAADAITLKLGSTATARIKMRAVQRMLPDLSAEDLDQIESELEAQSVEEKQSDALSQEIASAETKAKASEDETQRPSDSPEDSPPDGADSAGA